MKSIHAFILIAVVWFCLGAFYYPKWKYERSEAAISWDVSGYYHYLPAVFIYKDLKQQTWIDKINETYLPSPAYDQSFIHPPSGNKVNKYPAGQAVLYTPFFLSAHLYANLTDTYPADGYSRPYQVAIWLGSLLVAITGLFLIRKILLIYFTDAVTTWTLLALGLATNWVEYASISNGMNHAWLFTLLCSLILFVIRFYRKTDWISVIGIGLSLGLAALTRPTELVWALIPLLWGVQSIKERFHFLRKHTAKVLVAMIIVGVLGSIQLLYWKYVSNEWFVYTYGDQHFDWFHPTILPTLALVNSGWWIFTPMMFIAMFGWIGFHKKERNIFWAAFITFLLSLYITMSWGYWETGGGLGQRNLIQIYPLVAFPLATIISWFNRSTAGKITWMLFLGLSIYYTGWWIHQAHKGRFFHPGRMNPNYFFQVVGRLNPDPDKLKLLDATEYFQGRPQDLKWMGSFDFERDSLGCKMVMPDSTVAACLNKDVQFIGPFTLQVSGDCGKWLRVEGDFTAASKEWDIWKYAQWIVQFYKGEEIVKTSLFRLQYLVPEVNQEQHLHFDVKIPETDFEKCTLSFWNADSPQTILVRNLQYSCFSK